MCCHAQTALWGSLGSTVSEAYDVEIIGEEHVICCIPSWHTSQIDLPDDPVAVTFAASMAAMASYVSKRVMIENDQAIMKIQDKNKTAQTREIPVKYLDAGDRFCQPALAM